MIFSQNGQKRLPGELGLSTEFGDNYITIQFTVDENGNAKNFKYITSWGGQFYNVITNSIHLYSRFPQTKAKYFHMKVHVIRGRLSTYDFYFSDDLTPE